MRKQVEPEQRESLREAPLHERERYARFSTVVIER